MQISQAKLNQMLYEAKYGPDWTEHEYNMIDLSERLDERSWEILDHNQHLADAANRVLQVVKQPKSKVQ